MIKWLYEIVLAFRFKKSLGASFRQALRFVRCDFLTQERIRRKLKRCKIEDCNRKES